MPVSDRRLYLTEDDRVVEEGDPDAAFLLVGAGCEIEPDVAKRYGLEFAPRTVKPSGNKSKKPSGNK